MQESLRPVIPPYHFPRQSTVPTARDWRLHGLLFLLTVVTTIFAGLLLSVPEPEIVEPRLSTPLDYVLYVPLGYLHSVAAYIKLAVLHPQVLLSGIAFSVSLLAILLSHEMGHYLACRYYGVDATMPYFIPAPPLFIAGTFGAFIKIRSPIPSRRALFDIGLAGPLAGFVVAVPISVIGLLKMQPPVPIQSGIFFNDPLLFRLLAPVLGVQLDPSSPTNPYYMAAWIGLLVTSLNLMPVGQLDGGHGTFAVFGQRAHHIIGRVALVLTAVFAGLGFWLHGSPSGLVFTILLAIMMRVKHPAPPVMEPLGAKRVVLAIVTLLVFAVSFWPFPISIR